MVTINELEKSLHEEIMGNAEDILKETFPEDRIIEIADSYIPVYNHELIECLIDDKELAYVEDRSLLGPWPSVWDVLQTSIYERLLTAAYEALEEIQQVE
jgi:hypothetical protein